MSWSAYNQRVTAEEAGDALVIGDLILAGVTPAPEMEEVKEQIGVAAELIHTAIASGVVGSARSYTVTAAGHANPGHAETPGFGGDSLSISVSVHEYEVEAAPTEAEVTRANIEAEAKAAVAAEAAGTGTEIIA